MLEPLQQFICDTCGQIIQRPEEGWLEWLYDIENQTVEDFRIVHHKMSSPLDGREGCYQHGDSLNRADDHLHNIQRLLIPELLMHLDIGPYHAPDGPTNRVRDMRNYVEVFRRLTIPYYEEARIFWDQAIANGDFAGYNELTPYIEDSLREIIENYSDY